MFDKLQKSELFKGMPIEEIKNCLSCSLAQLKFYSKNQIVFSELEIPKYLYVLLDGNVILCRDSLTGKRDIRMRIEKINIFGEIDLFTRDCRYEYYALTTEKSEVLEIPRDFFFRTCNKACKHHSTVIYNMLNILAQRANFLDNKLKLLSSGNLRQKITKFILERRGSGAFVDLGMNREQFADFLNVARPSLSRELLKMRDEGIIELDRSLVKIIDLEALETRMQ